MGHRHMLCPNPMIDIEMNQGTGYFYQGHSVHLRPSTNFQQPNICAMVTASGSSSNFDTQYLPERYESLMFYGPTQYNVQHGSGYYSYMPPSSSAGVLPVALNHRSLDQLSSSNGYGIVGISADQFDRNNHFVDGARGPYKRKTPEGIPGNHQTFNTSANSSSVVPALNTRHADGVAASDPASFSLPRYMGNGNPSVMEVQPQNGVRNGLVAAGLESAMMHDHNHHHLVQGNYMSPHFTPSHPPWLEHLSSNSGDVGASAWNLGPSIPFMHGGNGVGSIDIVNMGMPRYHETSNSRGSQSVRHPPQLSHRHQNHHPLPHVQGPRSLNNLPSAHYRSSNSSRISSNSSHNGPETGHRQPGTVPPTGLRIYRPHRDVIPDATSRRQQLAQLRLMRTDEVAILDLPDFYEVEDLIDHHSDMRLDIEDMSYEELLALGERIGNVNTGLTEEMITRRLKTMPYLSSGTEECPEKEAECCIICQDNYKNLEKVGSLDCGHEYHAECLKNWLVLKNVCPICKSEALSTGSKKGV
ncbi:hypothetical protein UlMin_027437 [Ulmus minor]